MHKDHAAENHEIDATVQETSDRLNKNQSTESDEYEFQHVVNVTGKKKEKEKGKQRIGRKGVQRRRSKKTE